MAKIYLKIIKQCAGCPNLYFRRLNKISAWRCRITKKIIELNKIDEDCPLEDAEESDEEGEEEPEEEDWSESGYHEERLQREIAKRMEKENG